MLVLMVIVGIGCSSTWWRTMTVEETTRVRLRVDGDPAAEACHRRCAERPRGTAACLARCSGASVTAGACDRDDALPKIACVATSRVKTEAHEGRCQNIEPRAGVAVTSCTDREMGSIGGSMFAIILLPSALLVYAVSQIGE